MSRKRMPEAIGRRIDADLRTSRNVAQAGESDQAWAMLEEAHVLSQPWAWPHLRVHLAMLGLGWRERDRREVAGQLVRLVLAAPGSATGRYPVGNIGRATVPATQPMEIPAELRELLEMPG